MRRARSIGHGGGDSAARPVPPVSKRQRMMEEEFQQLSIEQNGDMKLPAYPSSWPPTTTRVGETTMTDDDEAMNSSQDEHATAEQEAERKVMYQLALGKAAPGSRPKDPVDAKLEEMIRHTRLQLSQQQKAKDDFDIQTPYSHGTMMMEDTVPRQRLRSNSLPRDWDGTMEDLAKDIDMML